MAARVMSKMVKPRFDKPECFHGHKARSENKAQVSESHSCSDLHLKSPRSAFLFLRPTLAENEKTELQPP